MEDYRKLFSNKSKQFTQTGSKTSAYTFDNYQQSLDLSIEKQYLQKLKAQRQKTQKLYNDYVDLLNHKEQLKNKIVQLQKILQQNRKEHEKLSQENQKKINLLIFQLQNLKEQLSQTVKDRKKSLQDLQEYYESTVRQYKTQIDDLKILDQQKTLRIQKLSELCQQKTNQLDFLSDKYENQKKQFQKTLYEKEKIVIDVQVKLQERHKQETNRKKQNEKIQRQNEKLKNEIQFKKQQYDSMKKILQTLKSTEKQQSKQIKQLKQKLTNVNGLKQQMKKSYSSKIKQLEANNTRLHSKSIKQTENIKIQLEIKTKSLQSQISKLSKQLLQAKQIIQKYAFKCEKLEKDSLSIKQPYELLIQNLKMEIQTLKIQLKKQRQGLQEQFRKIKEQNELLLNFIKQKQVLERQRRDLVSNQLKEIDKFQKLLSSVNLK